MQDAGWLKIFLEIPAVNVSYICSKQLLFSQCFFVDCLCTQLRSFQSTVVRPLYDDILFTYFVDSMIVN